MKFYLNIIKHSKDTRIKNLLLLLVIPLLSLTLENDNTKFIGKWSGLDQNQIGYISFDSEGYAAVEIDGEVLGGKEFEQDGHKGSMTYEINSKKNPIQIDLILTWHNFSEVTRVLCIAKFIDDNTMKFSINFEGNRPKNFNSENSIILKREF